jgi:7-cyano-7-deazaguanine synthase in queuosine biosynthesis
MREVFVRRKGTETGGTDLVLEPGKNLRTGERDFERQFGPPTSIERDLMLIAASVFAADRCIARGDREYQNRSIKISVPVVNTAILIPAKNQLEDILRTLSHDDWRIEFRQEKANTKAEAKITSNEGSTLLFSGGLDSLAATIQYGREKQPLNLVSHVTKNRPTQQAQTNLYELLLKKKFNIRHNSFFVSAVSTAPTAETSFSTENSQRTRSFLFVTFGALTARRKGNQKLLFIAENGQLAVHLPLNPARAGAFSTHTAHPEVLSKMKAFFSNTLGINLEILNPYQHMTKAEVVGIVRDRLPAAIELSVSCWMNAHLPKGTTHCGYCIPCIIRRIAIETHGIDQTAYVRDLFSENVRELGPTDDGRRNLYDFVEFNYQIDKLSPAEISDKWPEVVTVAHSSDVIKMYKRAAQETRKVLQSHSATASLFK